MEAEILSESAFSERLVRSAGPLSEPVVTRLYRYYRCLLRWNERLALVGRSDVAHLVERHFAESLLARPWLGPGPGNALDIGSGGGFPGIVLAAASYDLRWWLVEARERKWAFLEAAAREAEIDAACVHGVLDRGLPPELPAEVSLVTLRAVKLPMHAWRALLPRVRAAGRLLVWAGSEDPVLPSEWLLRDATSVPGSSHRRLLVFEKVAGGAR